MLFTSIQALRNSHAMQDRVTKVENWLKKQVPGWDAANPFPIFAIGNSNPVEDVEWVFEVSSVHYDWPQMEQAVLNQFTENGEAPTADDHVEFVRQELRKSKTKTLEMLKEKYTAAYIEVHGSNVGSPLLVEVAATAEAQQAPTAQENTVSQTATQNEAKVETAVASSVVTESAVQGAMYVGIGKIMHDKEKNFEDAVKYSLSPTGGRLFTAFVENHMKETQIHSMASAGECMKRVRVALRELASKQ